jgi:uncharacterized protein involved in cysteine biosynthesis
MLASLLFGLTLPLQALGLILRRPRLLALSALPTVLVFALDWFVIMRLQTTARLAISAWLASHGVAPEGWIGMVAIALTWVALILAGVLTFNFAANLAALPFNDFLAEATEAAAGLPPSGRTGWRWRARILSLDALKSALALLALAATLLISWVPVLNLFGMLGALWLLSFQYLSYPQTRRGEGVAQGVAFLWRHKLACSGFGAVCSLGFAVPFASALFLPLAVVGGTLLYARAQRPGLR